MAEEKESGVGVSLELTSDGGKLAVSDHVVDRTSGGLSIFFTKRIARSRIDLAVADRITKKIAAGDYKMEPAETAFLSIIYEKEFRRVENQQKVLERARLLLPEMRALLPEKIVEEPQAARTTDDWVDRFLETVGAVSEEQIQELYARVAAGEVVQPGRFSMRTLSILRDLDASTVSSWHALRNLTFHDRYLIPFNQASEHYSQCGLTYDSFVHLETCGLLKMQLTRPVAADQESDPATRIHSLRYGDRAIRYKAKTRDEAAPECWSLTLVGLQLSELRIFAHDESFFRLLLTFIGRIESATVVVSDRYRDEIEWTQDGTSWSRDLS